MYLFDLYSPLCCNFTYLFVANIFEHILHNIYRHLITHLYSMYLFIYLHIYIVHWLILRPWQKCPSGNKVWLTGAISFRSYFMYINIEMCDDIPQCVNYGDIAVIHSFIQLGSDADVVAGHGIHIVSWDVLYTTSQCQSAQFVNQYILNVLRYTNEQF